MSPDGLSPRLWGTVLCAFPIVRQYRFIPTPVGNGFYGQRVPAPYTVYPHACGERCLMNDATCWQCGLSPRLWGTEDRALDLLDWMRFIPTPVGNGQVLEIIDNHDLVYPHACGERREQGSRYLPASGLSPRLWGTG